MKTSLWILLSVLISSRVHSQGISEKKYETQIYDVAPSIKSINGHLAEHFNITSIFNNLAGGCGVVLSTNSGFDHQLHRVFSGENVNDSLQKQISKGFFISGICGFDKSNLSVVFSSQKNNPKQQIICGNEFPRASIKELSDSGYKLTCVANNESQWLVVMSLTEEIEAQDYSVEKNIPRAFIRDSWENGLSITEVTYSFGSWLVVMSKTKHLGLQAYETNSKFPTEWIKKKWKEGYRITSMVKGTEWMVVMSSLK
jgi:hypothetical protein